MVPRCHGWDAKKQISRNLNLSLRLVDVCAVLSTYSFLHARRIRRTASIKEAVGKSEVADSLSVVVHLIRNRSDTIRNRKNQCQDA
jgi:hypothetical protein